MVSVRVLRALAPLDAATAAHVRRRAIVELGKADVQVGDDEVIAPFALALAPAAWRTLAADAEALARETHHAERELLDRPDLVRALALPRALAHTLRAPQPPRHVRVMRFDFHLTDDRAQPWRISENNSDVPGGFLEGGALTHMFAALEARPTCGDPADALARALAARVQHDRVALVHAVAHSEDRQVMDHLARAFAQHGLASVLWSPDDVEERALGAVVRFFPAEWLPRTRGAWRRWSGARGVVHANPLCAVLAQSKRFPLAWPRLRAPLPTWRRLLPETRDVRDVAVHERGAWVLKPALGRVGEDVMVPGVASERALARAWRRARWLPRRWIAQRKFRARAIDTPLGLRFPSLGVFVVDGRAAGIYARLSRSAKVDGWAQDVAVLLDDDGADEGARVRA